MGYETQLYRSKTDDFDFDDDSHLIEYYCRCSGINDLFRWSSKPVHEDDEDFRIIDRHKLETTFNECKGIIEDIKKFLIKCKLVDEDDGYDKIERIVSNIFTKDYLAVQIDNVRLNLVDALELLIPDDEVYTDNNFDYIINVPFSLYRTLRTLIFEVPEDENIYYLASY